MVSQPFVNAFQKAVALRLEINVRDVGLRGHTSHAQDVLDMLLGLKMGAKKEKPNELCLHATRRQRKAGAFLSVLEGL